MAQVKITKRGHARSQSYFYDRYRISYPYNRAPWLTLWWGGEEVLHIRWSDVDDVWRVN